MVLKKEILNRENDFKTLCDSHKVKYLYAFGSSVSGKFDIKKSDFDFLVELDVSDPLDRGENLMSLWDDFESFFQRKVDLLTESSIRNPYLRKSIDDSKVLIYDGRGQKILI